MSLRKKLISTFLILMLLIFLPLIYIIQTKIKPMNMNQVEMQTLELLTSKSNEVGSWLNQRISELKILNEFPGCKTLNFVELKPYLAEINKNFKENYGNIPDNFAIGGIDGIGWINENITIDVSERDYFKEAMTSNKPYVISTPVISKSHQNPIFLICYSILSNEGEKIGFINGAIDLDVISSITSNINIYDGFSWIMNRNTDIYTSSNSSFDKIDLNRDILDLIVNESSTTSTGIINLDKNLNRNDSVFYTSVPYANDWILCTLINNNKLYYQSNQIFNIISTVIIVLFVGYIITAIIISSSLAKPVEKLKLHMLKVSDGDLNLVYNTNTTIKEISDLGLFLNQMVYKIKNLINETHTAYELKRTAELRALQSQINPHFLYNTLDTIQWKALHHKAFDVVEMIQLLSELFRLSLSNGKENILVSDEISHVETYLKIQKIRYKDTINYTIDKSNLTKDIYIPKLIIQPLIENSIYHGIKPKKINGQVVIKIYNDTNFIYISVYDNGIGIEASKLSTLINNLNNSIESDHYGLYNVNERLKLSFRDNYYISIESKENEFTTILLKIPMSGVK